MKTPVVWMLVSLILGLLGGMYKAGSFAGFGISAMILLGLLFKKRIEPVLGRRIWMLLMLCFLIGIVRGRMTFACQRSEVSGETESIGGIIHSLNTSSSENRTVDIQAEGVQGLVRVTIPDDLEVSEGMYLEAEGILEKPELPSNPGCFNPVVYDLAHGIQYLMDPDEVSVSTAWNLYSLRGVFQSVLRKRLTALLPEDACGVVMAILSGDRTDLATDLRELFQDCGIAHIIAISGLHIQILASALEKLLKKWIPLKPAILAELILIGVYCFLTGSAVSTLRAFLQLAMKLAAVCAGRKEYPPASMAVSAFVLLIYRPIWLFYSSFLLSYGAQISIRFGMRVIDRMFGIPAGWRRRLGPSFCVTAFTLSLTMYYFYQFCPYSVLLNLVVIPLMSVVVLMSILAVLLSPLWHAAALVCMGSVYAVIRFYQRICQMVSFLPFSTVTTGRPQMLVMVCCGVLLLLLILYAGASADAKQKRKFLAGLLIPIIVILICHFEVFQDDRFYLLDTGQGDCAVFFSRGKTVIVDAGPEYEYVLSEVLQSEGVTYVDAVFLSHMDEDHSEGVISLLEDEDYTVGTLYLPDIEGIMEESEAFQYAQEIVLMQAGESAVYGGFTFTCLSPDPLESYEDENSASMCLRVASDSVTMLMTGDIDQDTEEKILSAGYDVSCDILKVAHHGSDSSSTSAFLNALAADIAYISCGENNLYGHPSETVLERLKEAGTDAFISWESGALCFQHGRMYLYKEAYAWLWMQ